MDFFVRFCDLSMGYRRQTGKILFLGPFGPARTASSAPIGGRAGLRAGWHGRNRSTRPSPSGRRRENRYRTNQQPWQRISLPTRRGASIFAAITKGRPDAWRDPSPIGRRWRGAPDEGRRAAAIVRQAAPPRPDSPAGALMPGPSQTEEGGATPAPARATSARRCQGALTGRETGALCASSASLRDKPVGFGGPSEERLRVVSQFEVLASRFL